MDYRTPPQNIEAEQGVLGCMITDNETVLDVLDILVVDDFYKEQNKEIFNAISALNSSQEPVDIISVGDKLQKRGTFDTVGGYDYLQSICNGIPTSQNATHYAKLVEEQSKRRKLITVARDIHRAAYEDDNITDIVDKAEKNILTVNKHSNSDFVLAASVAEEAIQFFEDRCKNKGKVSGLPTGFADLDFKLGGLQDGELIIIAARPSMGKTSLAENIGTYVSCNKQLPVAFFSMEMKRQLIINRIFSSTGMVDNTKMKLGTIDETDWQNIASALREVETGKLVIDDTPNIKASEIRSKCRKIKHKMGDLRLIIVDHLTEMWRPCKGDDTGEHEENVRAMKRLASEMNCPVILLQQLNRGVEYRADKRPQLSDLKETGASEEVADVVMFIYRDDYYKPDTEKKNIAEIIVAKGRNVGTGTVEMRWFGEYTKFAQLDKSYTPPPQQYRKPTKRRMPDDED